MIKILIDTCVWIDLAKEYKQRVLINVVEELAQRQEISLLVPRIIINEFEAHKKRIIKESSQSLSGVIRRVKDVVDKFGDSANKKAVLNQLDDVDHKIPLLGETVIDTVARIEKLLISSTIIEIYSDCVSEKNSKRSRFAFVTHNTSDFSLPNGNNKFPHPDIASYFSKIKSLYFINLAETLYKFHPEFVNESMIEEEWMEEPRKLTEIIQAIGELIDKVWYNHHMNWLYKIETGEHQIVENNSNGKY